MNIRPNAHFLSGIMCTSHELLSNIRSFLISLEPAAIKHCQPSKPLKSMETKLRSWSKVLHREFKCHWWWFHSKQHVIDSKSKTNQILFFTGLSNGNSAQLRILPAGKQELRAGKNLVLTCRAQVSRNMLSGLVSSRLRTWSSHVRETVRVIESREKNWTRCSRQEVCPFYETRRDKNQGRWSQKESKDIGRLHLLVEKKHTGNTMMSTVKW